MCDFSMEKDAYLRIKSELLSKHRGKFAAIYRGRLIAVGADKSILIAQVRDEYGPIRALIQKIEDHEPKIRSPIKEIR